MRRSLCGGEKGSGNGRDGRKEGETENKRTKIQYVYVLIISGECIYYALHPYIDKKERTK